MLSTTGDSERLKFIPNIFMFLFAYLDVFAVPVGQEGQGAEQNSLAMGLNTPSTLQQRGSAR